MRNALYFSIFAALMGAGASAAAATLSDLQWDYRVIAVFAPTDTDAADARDTLERSDGIADRDIAWFVVSPGGTASNLDRRIDRNALIAMHDNDGFEAVLVGKDGGVKSRQTEEFDLQAFFGEIDQMPMRQNEMQSNP